MRQKNHPYTPPKEGNLEKPQHSLELGYYQSILFPFGFKPTA